MKRFLQAAGSRALSLGAFVLAATAMVGCGAGGESVDSADESVQANCNLLDANSQGFEGRVGEWGPWYSTSVARSTAAAKAGSASLLVTVTDPYGWGIGMNDWPGVTASPGAVNISFWAKRAAGN